MNSLGDGEGGLFAHLYDAMGYGELDYSLDVDFYGEEYAKRKQEESEQFLQDTLPIMQTYGRYEIKADESEHAASYHIYDRFQPHDGSFGNWVAEDGERLSFSSAKEAREYLESELRSNSYIPKHHAKQNREIAKERVGYQKAKIEAALKEYPMEQEKLLETVRALGINQKDTVELISAKDNSFSYIADGKIVKSGISLEQAMVKLMIDNSLKTVKDVKIVHDFDPEMSFVSKDNKRLLMPIQKIDERLHLKEQPKLREELISVLQKMVPLVHVDDPRNLLNMPFEQYAQHEDGNPWKYPETAYAAAGISLSDYTKEKLDELNHESGHFLSAFEVIRLLASKKNGNAEAGKDNGIRKDSEELLLETALEYEQRMDRESSLSDDLHLREEDFCAE